MFRVFTFTTHMVLGNQLYKPKTKLDVTDYLLPC